MAKKLYDLLGVSERATSDEIHSAWEGKMFESGAGDGRAHPRYIQDLHQAHDILMNDRDRGAYDHGHFNEQRVLSPSFEKNLCKLLGVDLNANQQTINAQYEYLKAQNAYDPDITAKWAEIDYAHHFLTQETRSLPAEPSPTSRLRNNETGLERIFVQLQPIEKLNQAFEAFARESYRLKMANPQDGRPYPEGSFKCDKRPGPPSITVFTFPNKENEELFTKGLMSSNWIRDPNPSEQQQLQRDLRAQMRESRGGNEGNEPPAPTSWQPQ